MHIRVSSMPFHLLSARPNCCGTKLGEFERDRFPMPATAASCSST